MSWLSGAGASLTPNPKRLAGGWACFKGLKNIRRIIKNASASDEMVTWGRRLPVAALPLENVRTWLQIKQKYAANRHSDLNVLTAESRSDGAARGSQRRRRGRQRGGSGGGILAPQDGPHAPVHGEEVRVPGEVVLRGRNRV